MVRIAGIVLIGVGVLGLVYGGFSYTRQTDQAQLGPLKLTVSDTQTVNVPIWAGVGTIVLGGVMLVLATRKR